MFFLRVTSKHHLFCQNKAVAHVADPVHYVENDNG